MIFLDIFCILDPKWNDDIQAEKLESGLEWLKYGIPDKFEIPITHATDRLPPTKANSDWTGVWLKEWTNEITWSTKLNANKK